MKERDILIWLNSIQGISNNIISNLKNYYGNLNIFWEISDKELSQLNFINNKTKNKIIKFKNDLYYENIIKSLDKAKVDVITILDESYPESLRYIYDPPFVLYSKGSIQDINKETALGIVGSRKATYYGKWTAGKFAHDLANLGITITSGMARGIDTEAHIGAIKAKGKTIAVLGCGVDVIYPKSNKNLYHAIIENGAVLSEYPLGVQPLPYHFPQRNRIISGLSLGIMVVEAQEKSGSLITVEHALEQGKEVYAIPGNINSLYSKGTNLLIKDGAKIVTSIEDILEDLPIDNTDNKSILSKNIELSDTEKKVVACISRGNMYSDLIAHHTNIPIAELAGMLTILEMKGIIEEKPGKIFMIKA